MLRKLFLFVHTIRYLKWIQLYWRINLKLKKYLVFSVDISLPIESRSLSLNQCIEKHTSLVSHRITFLNESRAFDDFPDWQTNQASKLWLYFLHYFDYLNQRQMDTSDGYAFIKHWIENNPVAIGEGWEPYPISLRIVNWIKFFSRSSKHNAEWDVINKSLYLQSRFLFQHLEYHLLGNHLFKNGVALIFAGAYFVGDEAESWLQKGKEILFQQLQEQVLTDGGHFERSPMYHAITLDDVLDCVNLGSTSIIFSFQEYESLKDKARKMAKFLFDMLHSDNEIPFFNDSAINIAPSPKQLFKYAECLKIDDLNKHQEKSGSLKKVPIVIDKPDSGFYIFENYICKCIFDAGPIGPDYLPGHAHCDTLSYELSLGKHRCIVNTGTYQYAGQYRNTYRGTRAHNTVQIDQSEQHEIWSTFRVARRSYPFDVQLKRSNDDSINFSAALSGFKRLAGNPVHRRSIHFQNDKIIIDDIIEGKGNHLAENFIHLHPKVEILNHYKNLLECKLGEILFSIEAIDEQEFYLKEGWYSPEFGIKEKNVVLLLRKQGTCPFSIGYRINFNL